MGFDDEEGLGVGVGLVVLLGDGLVVGLGLLVAFFVVDELGEGVALGDVPVDVLADVLGAAEVLVDLLGVGLGLADAAALRAATTSSVSDAMSTEFLGTDEQDEEASTIGWLREFVARASPDMVAVKKANPVRAPITTGFASCALTRKPHFSASSGQNVFGHHIMHCQPDGN